ncbi:unnamed protein product [Mytilus edulis]|uniref:Uncharacterized protein n=1 Tax=Mytilus edulis TaxID=6550 RepID=A0A8S3RVK8_MYTED|nr:unnamed protein product [Mytilus edulis]
MDGNPRNHDYSDCRNLFGMKKTTYWEIYGVKRFPYHGKRKFTPLLSQSFDGGMVISNDVFGLTISQFERVYKACLERRKTKEQWILNLRYPDKSSKEYLEYLENCTDCNKDNLFWPGNDTSEKYLYEHLRKPEPPPKPVPPPRTRLRQRIEQPSPEPSDYESSDEELDVLVRLDYDIPPYHMEPILQDMDTPVQNDTELDGDAHSTATGASGDDSDVQSTVGSASGDQQDEIETQPEPVVIPLPPVPVPRRSTRIRLEPEWMRSDYIIHGLTNYSLQLKAQIVRDNTRTVDEVIVRDNTRTMDEVIVRDNTRTVDEVIVRDNTRTVDEVIVRDNTRTVDEVIVRDNTRTVDEVIVRDNTRTMDEVIVRDNTRTVDEVVDGGPSFLYPYNLFV